MTNSNGVVLLDLSCAEPRGLPCTQYRVVVTRASASTTCSFVKPSLNDLFSMKLYRLLYCPLTHLICCVLEFGRRLSPQTDNVATLQIKVDTIKFPELQNSLTVLKYVNFLFNFSIK